MVAGGGEYILAGDGWWWVLVDIFWLLVDGGGYILAGGGWWWVVVGVGGYILAGGGWWCMVVGRPRSFNNLREVICYLEFD